jgi:hypothetical protein
MTCKPDVYDDVLMFAEPQWFQAPDHEERLPVVQKNTALPGLL